MTDSGISCALVAVPAESGRAWADHTRAIVTPPQMADTLLEFRATLGIDEFVVPEDLTEFFVPVITRLSGGAG